MDSTVMELKWLINKVTEEIKTDWSIIVIAKYFITTMLNKCETERVSSTKT